MINILFKLENKVIESVELIPKENIECLKLTRNCYSCCGRGCKLLGCSGRSNQAEIRRGALLGPPCTLVRLSAPRYVHNIMADLREKPDMGMIPIDSGAKGRSAV